MAEEKPKVLIFILAYNEENSLGELIREIRDKVGKSDFDWDLVVVDDGSSDSTRLVASRHEVRVIRHPVNLGIGAAEQTGLLYAKKKKFNAAVRIDGDGQHPPESVAGLVGELANGRAHLVIGSRFIKNQAAGYRSTPLRRAGIRFFSFLCFLLSGRRVKDPTSGFRCFGPESIDLLTKAPPPDFPEVESFIDVARSGLKINEVPAAFRSRRSGSSSIKIHHSIYFMIKVTMAILVASIRIHEKIKPQKEKAENVG